MTAGTTDTTGPSSEPFALAVARRRVLRLGRRVRLEVVLQVVVLGGSTVLVGNREDARPGRASKGEGISGPVSYTHLTLPTICSV